MVKLLNIPLTTVLSHNGISYSGKITSLYRIRALAVVPGCDCDPGVTLGKTAYLRSHIGVEYWCVVVNLMTWCYQVHPFRYRIQVYTRAEDRYRLIIQRFCFTSWTKPYTKITSVNTTKLHRRDWMDNITIVNGSAKIWIWMASVCRRNKHTVQACILL